MTLDHAQLEQPLRRIWWLSPAALFALVVGITILAAANQSDAAFRLYGAPKFITAKHVVLAAAAIFAFVIGQRLAEVTGRIPPSTGEAVDRVVRIWFWLATGLTLFGYAAWLAMGIKNGFSLSLFREFLATDDPLVGDTIREDMFVKMKGITTCTQFGVAALPLGLWLYFRGERTLVLPVLGLLLGLGTLRALVFSERMAVFELGVPAAVILLRTCVLGRRLTPFARSSLQLAPLVGIVAMLLVFGSFEYFRSWRYYRKDFDSYSEFIVWRVTGYYTTAHNNSAMALETQPPFPLPYSTVRHLWSIPGLSRTPFGYAKLTGVDPTLRHEAMLERFGTIELNSDGGLFQPALDYGLAGFVLFWFGGGFVAGRLYRSFLVGTLAGLTCYPILFLAILESPRYLYVSYTRALPAEVTLLIVIWLASRARYPATVASAVTAIA